MNTGNFWNPFGTLFRSMYDNGFIENSADYHVHTANTTDELFAQILECKE